jgi:Lrp/AsnC family transcriptional regulator, leucine-responsive regulatory protein
MNDRLLDEIDLKILAQLQLDGRLSNADLAKRVGLTPSPCLERVKRLERDGVIRGYSAIVHPEAISRALLLFVQVKVSKARQADNQKFREAVLRIPDVLECHMVGGGFDYLVKLRVRDMFAYRDVYARSLAELPGVSDLQTYFVIEELKSTTSIPIDEA